jgi:hypothetical protein
LLQQRLEQLVQPLFDPLGPDLGGVDPFQPQRPLGRRLCGETFEGGQVQGVAFGQRTGHFCGLAGLLVGQVGPVLVSLLIGPGALGDEIRLELVGLAVQQVQRLLEALQQVTGQAARRRSGRVLRRRLRRRRVSRRVNPLVNGSGTVASWNCKWNR